jgi:predicted RND superfamily exporter protein
MEIKVLKADKYKGKSDKLDLRIDTFQIIIAELNNKDVTDAVATQINIQIDSLNAFSGDAKLFRKQLYKTQTKILALVKKELKLVPINHYRSLWMAIGMAAFGMPIGVAYGTAIGNMGLLAIGIPIGMVIGMAVGAGMDKKAKQEGKQLNVEIKL